MAGAVLVVRSLLKRVRIPFDGGSTILGDSTIGRLGSGNMPEREEIYIPPAEEEISKEALVRAERRNRIVEYISTKPEDASRLLKVWLKAEN
jgi:flagellar biosynthesis/type III secretory pathway M-ring protein FliF/YscJ